MTAQPPAILLVYANDRDDPARHLRSLADEIGLIRDALQAAEQGGLCQVLIEANASAERLLTVFQDARYRHRIAVLHYAGHSDEYRLLFESSATGGTLSDRGTAYAAGLAAFLGEQRGLELVFLNGCSTAPQVQGLLDAGCPAVIATAQAIDDRVAKDFAARFYRGLGAGAGLESAFQGAAAATRTAHGDSPRGLYWDGATDSPPLADRWPWEFHTRPGAEQTHHWNLPEAAGDPLFGLPDLPKLDLPESPFRQLEWFAREHAEVFFGRAFQIRALYDWVTSPEAPPILLFYGQSGVGKSSVLAAGLLPRLESSHWVHYLRRDPALGLLGTLIQPLNVAADGPGAAWRRTEEAAGRPLLLVLDQAEEVFTRPADDQAEELSAFLTGLQAIFSKPDARPCGRLILSFRKEWLPELEARLAEQRLPRGRLFLESLDRRGIIAAVEGPARSERLRAAFGIQIEDGLSGEIADDLLADRESPVAPTLQILLTKLWDEARRRDFDHPRFSRDLYLQLSHEGILLKDFLNQQLAALEQWRPEVVQSGLALDLLAAHTTARGTADQHTEQELLTTYAQVQQVIPSLVQRCKDGYLLADIATTQQEPVKGSRLAHDAIAPMVRERFEKSDRPGQRARRILENRVMEWRNGATGTLLDDADLRVVEEGVTGMRDSDTDERRLIDQSRRARDGRRWARQARRLAAACALLAIVVSGLFSYWQWQETEKQKRIAIARLQASLALAESDKHPIRALLLAVESVKRPWDSDGLRLGGPESLLRELIASIGGIPLNGGSAVAFDPKGRWLATGGRGRDRAPVGSPAPRSPSRGNCTGTIIGFMTLAFDAQGRWLAGVGSEDATAHLWDLQHIESEPRELGGHEGGIATLAFDPQGRWLATGGSEDGTARLWDLQHIESEPRESGGHEGGIATLAFDPQGRWLATLGSEDGIARLWDLQQPGANPRELGGREVRIDTLAFDPRDRWLATGGSEDGTARLWDLQNPESEPRELRGQQKGSEALAFDPQGRWLATWGSGDWTVRLWDLQHPESKPRELWGHQGAIHTLAFDPQGRWLATGSEDGTALLWDLQRPESKVQVLRGRQGWIDNLAFDAQGRWLATGGSKDGTARLWDLQNPESEPRELRGHDGGIHTLAFDPQGRWLATGSEDGTARLWDLQHRELEPEPRELRDCGIGIEATLAFDPLDHWLAIGGGPDGIACLWDLENPESEQRLEYGNDTLAFDPQGRWLATGVSVDGTVRLWDLQQPGAKPRELGGHEGRIDTLAFDPQGRWLASVGSEDGTARLWDLQQPGAKPRELGGREVRIDTLAFHPQGRWLATRASEDGTARLWDLQQPESEPRELGGREVRIDTLAFDAQGRWLATGGSEDGTARLWDLQHIESEPRESGGHEGGIATLAFDAQGRWLATLGSEDGIARLWDLPAARGQSAGAGRARG